MNNIDKYNLIIGEVLKSTIFRFELNDGNIIYGTGFVGSVQNVKSDTSVKIKTDAGTIDLTLGDISKVEIDDSKKKDILASND